MPPEKSVETSEYYRYARSAWCAVSGRVRRHLVQEDAIQEAALHCWAVRDKFRPDGMKLYAFMVMCASRHLLQLSIVRSRKKNTATLLSMDARFGGAELAIMDTLADPSPRPCELAAHNDELAHVMAKLSELPDNQQYVTWLHRIQGWTLEEVASTLGVTRQRVQQIERKALDYVRERVLGLNHDEPAKDHRQPDKQAVRLSHGGVRGQDQRVEPVPALRNDGRGAWAESRS